MADAPTTMTVTLPLTVEATVEGGVLTHTLVRDAAGLEVPSVLDLTDFDEEDEEDEDDVDELHRHGVYDEN